MQVITTFRNESIGGISINILKSGLQKFIRRDEVNNALDIISMVLLCDEKRIVTNFVNRLIVMISEEVSINNINTPIAFKVYLDRYHNGDKEVLYEMCLYLLNCKKYRLISDYKTVFNLKPYYLSNEVILQNLHCELLKKYNMDDICEIYQYNMDEKQTYEKILENIKTKKIIEVFKYVSYTMLKNYKIANLWKILLKNCSGKKLDVVKSLKYIYTKMTHKEKPIYLYHAIMILCFDSIDDDFKFNIDMTLINESKLRIKNNIIIDFDKYDYIDDKHCGNKNKNEVDFAISGAFVKHECNSFANDTYRKMYIEFKEMIVISSKTKHKIEKNNKIEDNIIKKENLDIILKSVKGQKRTSYSKQFVYMMKDHVWKGPYENNCRKIKLFRFRSDLFSRWHSKVIFGKNFKDENDMVWLRFPFFGDSSNMSHTIEKDLNGEDIMVLDRNSIGVDKLSDRNLQTQIDILFGEKMLIKTFIHACVLKCGDVGLWNALVYKNDCYMIDFEEARTSSVNSINDLFTKRIKNQDKIFACIKDDVKLKVNNELQIIENDLDYLFKCIKDHDVSDMINDEYIINTLSALKIN